jgi:hypothetical protein
MKNKKSFGAYPRDEDKFAGEYIAIVKGKIVAHGRQPKIVIAEGKKFTREPLLTKVPSKGWKEAMVLCLKLNLKVKKYKFPNLV